VGATLEFLADPQCVDTAPDHFAAIAPAQDGILLSDAQFIAKDGETPKDCSDR
jgi:hypothetical protein